jgi:hypothetical protein
MLIKVTQEDIDNGERNEPCKCPVALACRRHGLVEPRVGYAGITDDRAPGCPIYNTPWSAREFAKLFDSGKRVYPFSFELQRPYGFRANWFVNTEAEKKP